MPRLLLFLLLLLPPSAAAQDAGQQVHAAAVAMLAERFPADAHRLAPRVVRSQIDVQGADSLYLVPAAGGDLPKGHTQVKAYAGHREVGHAFLYVAHFDSVLTARADVRDGDAVAPEDLSVAWVETTRFRGEPLRPADYRALAASGTVFADRPLRAGRALHAGDLRPPYAADTGDAVTVTYRRGRLTLQVACRAREPGYVGQVIRAYADDTQATYRVRLTGPGTAEWVATR